MNKKGTSTIVVVPFIILWEDFVALIHENVDFPRE